MVWIKTFLVHFPWIQPNKCVTMQVLLQKSFLITYFFSCFNNIILSCKLARSLDFFFWSSILWKFWHKSFYLYVDLALLVCFEFVTVHTIIFENSFFQTLNLIIYYFFAGCSQCNLELWWLFIAICRLWRSRRPRSCHLHSKKTAQFHQKSERLSNGQNWGRPGRCLRRIWQNTNWQRNCERTSCDCRKRGWHRWELEKERVANSTKYLLSLADTSHSMVNCQKIGILY